MSKSESIYTEKQKALRAAVELGYDDSIIARIKAAKSGIQITNAMTAGRLRLNKKSH